MKKFLLIQTAFLGDVVLATPVISELYRLHPQARIDVLVRKGNESLLENNPYINRVYTFDKKQGKFQSMFRLGKEFRASHYDEVINLQRYFSSGLIAVLSRGKNLIGFDKNPLSFFYNRRLKHDLKSGIHEVSRNLSCIVHHGALAIKRPELFPSDLDFLKVRTYSSVVNYCTFSPASVWFTKQLPKEKWIELGRKLAQEGKLYFLGGPGDQALCAEIMAEINHPNCFNLAGQLSLLQSAALMQTAKMNYVNDSGPMHLCSAMNAPVTAFYCSTVPSFGFGPLSEDARIVETSLNLSCRPCGVHGFKTCPKGHFQCGYSIEV